MFWGLYREAQHCIYCTFSKAVPNAPGTASQSKVISFNKTRNFPAHPNPHAWHPYNSLFFLKPNSHSLSWSWFLSSTPALKARQFISNWIFLNRQNSSFTYRNNSLILDELAVYDEIFSIFAFKSSWNVFTKLNIKWPFSIRGRTISVLLLIRFHTLWNQNRNVDEIKLSEGSTGIYALSAE